MFKPSVHGWRFARPHAPEPEVLGLGRAAREEGGPAGLAGGMCWAALDRYLAGARVPTTSEPPAPGTALYRELVRRQVSALDGVWGRVREWQSLADDSWLSRLPVPFPPMGSDLSSRSRAEWAGIRRTLDAGEPVLLTLLMEAEPYGRSEAAIQVLACGHDQADGRVSVALYDPTRPGQDDVRLGFRTRGPLEARLTGGRTVRAFFAIPYDRDRPRAVRAETFADRSVIGLNRKIRGRPSVVATRSGLTMIARNGDGALLHFDRPDGKPWEGANVTEREGMGGAELHSDPVALAGSFGGIHVFARSYVGDLLHFSSLRRWRVANRTDGKRAGARFRLEGQPVPVRAGRGAIHVFGRSKDGVLVQYTGLPMRGWSAADIPTPEGQRLAHDPVALSHGGELHVFGVTRDGRLLHFHHVDDAWHIQEPLTSLSAGEAMRFEGAPTLLAADGTLQVFGRGPSDELVHVRLHGERGYQGGIIARSITGEPAACDGPGGAHVFAPTADGVVHAWNGPEWRTENLVTSRGGLDGAMAPRERLLAWGSHRELRVFGRNGRALTMLRWAGDSDWAVHGTADLQGVDERHRADDDIIIARDRHGDPHLLATDGRGTVVHYETGEWQEPFSLSAEAQRKAAEKRAARETVAKTVAAATPRPEPEAEPEPEPLPLLDFDSSADDGGDEEDDPAPLPLLDLEETGVAAPAPEAADPIAADLEETQPEPSEPESSEPEPEPAAPAAERQPFAWEEGDRGDGDPSDVEPLDLSLLESWPPAPPSMRKQSPQSKKKDSA